MPVQSIPWPSEGLRRVSVNSFGFGGSNTHVVLDDALHYMQQRCLTGNHCTARVPGALIDVTSIPSTIAQSDYTNANGHNHANVNGAASANGTTYTNGPARVNGNGAEPLTNGHINGLNAVTRQPRLLVWSAADKKALERMLESYETSSIDLGLDDPSKLDCLAVTLGSRRSQMLWRTFAVFPDAESGQEKKILSPIKPVRSSTDTGLAFVFTGQGAQYVGMGWDLIQYPCFAQTLRQVDDIYGSMGCGWSIFGKESARLTSMTTDDVIR